MLILFEQISNIIDSTLSQMTEGCRKHYLDNWDRYCVMFDTKNTLH
nr:MAG TPA: hypothetical protein [Caudoviricetes sp.]